MRRKEREVTDRKRINEIIYSCDCIRIGFYDKEADEVYIVPLSFGFDTDENIFYFHGALDGRKMDLIGDGCRVGFELDANHELVTGEKACAYSSKYQSIIGNGSITLVPDAKGKRAGLESIMLHYSDQSDWEFPDSYGESGLSISITCGKA